MSALVWACLAQTGAGVDRPGPNVTLQLPHPRRLEQSPVDDYLDVDFQTPLDFYGMGDGRLHANGKVFMLRGVNWYGPEGTSRILEGLDKRPMDDIFADLNFMGFNAVRLLFSAQEWMENAPLFWADAENDFLRLNPVLRGVDYRQMLGIVMQSAARHGILVLFALHRLRQSYSATVPGAWPGDWNGLWFEGPGEYSEDNVADMWEQVAHYYCGMWNLMGVDLMNEPHAGMWGSSRDGWVGDGEWADASKDWAVGAAKLGNKVLEYCPRLMIFVEGTGEYFVEWGQSFKGLAVNNMMAGDGPIRLKNVSKLVLSPHSYGPSLYKVPETIQYFPDRFKDPQFPHNLRNHWDENFGFLTEGRRGALGGRAFRPPMVVGETGGDATCCDIPGVMQRPGADREYQVELFKYLNAKDSGYFYFCLNPSSHDTGGLFRDDWVTLDQNKIEHTSI